MEPAATVINCCLQLHLNHNVDIEMIVLDAG